MWYVWAVLLVVSCVEVGAEAPAGAPTPATTRAPPRTLDRQAAELAWRSWLQSPESGNQNAPPRRITTKSLFITPLVCPKGQRLDSKGCVQVVTVNKDEHERILLEQLNALFTSSPSGDVIYDYGEEESNAPLQLSIPIGLDPMASPLQAPEPAAQAQEQHPSYVKLDKKDKDDKPDTAAGLVAELELLQLQHQQNTPNETTSVETDVLNHNVLLPFDKPKRDSPPTNSSEILTNDSDEGQKEQVYGHVNIDPILYNTETQTETQTEQTTETDTEQPTTPTTVSPFELTTNHDAQIDEKDNKTVTDTTNKTNNTADEIFNSTIVLRKEGDQSKLNPESDYADIGEAIKLISRYADVRTDDNFNKDQNKAELKDDSILGTRTKLQYRRKPKPAPSPEPSSAQIPLDDSKLEMPYDAPTKEILYRYPWQGQNSPTPPPNYPFRHVQDYWGGRNQIGGVYTTNHENPRRHHHAYPHNYYRPHSLPYANYPSLFLGLQDGFPVDGQAHPRRAVMPRHARPMRSHNNQDLYTLLGLRHWISSESTSKR